MGETLDYLEATFPDEPEQWGGSMADVIGDDPGAFEDAPRSPFYRCAFGGCTKSYVYEGAYRTHLATMHHVRHAR